MSAINRRQFFGLFATTAAGLAISRKFAKNPPENGVVSANLSDYRASNPRIHTIRSSLGSQRIQFGDMRFNGHVTRLHFDDFSKGFKPL